MEAWQRCPAGAVRRRNPRVRAGTTAGQFPPYLS